MKEVVNDRIASDGKGGHFNKERVAVCEACGYAVVMSRFLDSYDLFSVPETGSEPEKIETWHDRPGML